MNFQRTITPSIVVGDQPDEDDLRRFGEEGFAGVVNLRNDGEPEQPMDTSSEGKLVRSLGLEYLHQGIGSAPLADPGVASACDFIDRHSEGGKKVLVHCRKGGRAMALVLIQQARANGWTAAEALAKAGELGLQVEGQLRSMVEAYLSRPA